MPLTAEQNLIAGLLLALMVALGFGLYSVHLIDAGKADEKAAVFAQEQKDEAKAAALTASWQTQLTTAQTARQGEIDAAKATFLAPVPISVQHYTLSSAVPASPAAAGGSAAPAASGPVCSGLVPGSSGEMRSFAEAQSADQLIADYRDLYNSWPKAP
jgi:hypothetical protein